jgi:N-acetylmuramoyl-L-alanine amidase
MRMTSRAVAAALLAAALVSGSARAGDGAPPRSKALVAVDAGHTSAAPGAIGARGTRERDLNLAVARRVVRALGAVGVRAVLLGGGRDLTSSQRTELARRAGADVLVSIHHDSVQPRYLEAWTVAGVQRSYADAFRGFSVFFSRAGARPCESSRLASLVGGELRTIGLAPTMHHAEDIPGERRELVDADRGVYRYDDVAVLHHAAMPAVLVECGVIVNREEELLLRSRRRQDALSAAVARAVARFLRDREGAAACDP